jgi:hypothetical protein
MGDKSAEKLPHSRKEEASPIKASYQSASVIQQNPLGFLHRDGGTGGVYSEPALCYLSPEQEAELD